MTLILDRQAPALPFADRRSQDGERERKSGPIVNVALVNNMPDKALAATEQQFRRLLKFASRDRIVRLHCFSLPSIRRSPEVRQSIEGVYRDIADLDRVKLHGLVVTGAEPAAASLKDEAFWPELAELVDWAKHNTLSAIWSCLAAHAAVLVLDGIERRRLPSKCSGIFRCEKQRDHWLLRNLPEPVYVPHSRYNGLSGEALERCGYDILTRSEEVGVDSFKRDIGSEFIFLQGHPEYAATSLAREYRRDMRRYLEGHQVNYPDWPVGYFTTEAEVALDAFRQLAEAHRDPSQLAKMPTLKLRDDVSTAHQRSAQTLFTNWIGRLLAATATEISGPGPNRPLRHAEERVSTTMAFGSTGALADASAGDGPTLLFAGR